MGIKTKKPYQSDLWNQIYRCMKLANISATMRDSVDARTLSGYIEKLSSEIERGILNGEIKI